MFRISTLQIFLIFMFSAFGLSAQTSPPKNAPKTKQVQTSEFSNLYMINSGLYRSEQPDREGFEILSGLGIKSVLNLRSQHSNKEFITDLPLRSYHIRMNPSEIRDDEIITSLQILITAPKPILIHCHYGSDRTGVVIAMYRIVFEGWSKEDAINEMINGGYGFHSKHANIPAYIRNVDVEKIRMEVKNSQQKR